MPPVSTSGPPTQMPPSSGVHKCGFEASQNYCKRWMQESNDDFNWIIRSGSTPSSTTGPKKAFAGAKYAYIETSWPRKKGDQAIITAKAIAIEQGAYLHFKYQMHGKTMGRLLVQVTDMSGLPVEVFKESGNQGQVWKSGQIALDTRFAGKIVDISIIGERGSSWQGDLAIDDLELFQGSQGPAPSTTTTMTTTMTTTITTTIIATTTAAPAASTTTLTTTAAATTTTTTTMAWMAPPPPTTQSPPPADLYQRITGLEKQLKQQMAGLTMKIDDMAKKMDGKVDNLTKKLAEIAKALSR